jgi:hypothetical protein
MAMKAARLALHVIDFWCGWSLLTLNHLTWAWFQ